MAHIQNLTLAETIYARLVVSNPGGHNFVAFAEAAIAAQVAFGQAVDEYNRIRFGGQPTDEPDPECQPS